MNPLAARLTERAQLAGLALDDPLRTALLAYHALLTRWNATINLTALTDADEAIDRLLLEPVAAAAVLPRQATLMDLGSGGGSPAIPLALALSSPRLVMVESRGRKAAFLREAGRTVGLQATVEAVRFEDLAARQAYARDFQVVSMRAVRMDSESLAAAATFLDASGSLALFVSPGVSVTPPAPLVIGTRTALPGKAELVTVNVPRGTTGRTA